MINKIAYIHFWPLTNTCKIERGNAYRNKASIGHWYKNVTPVSANRLKWALHRHLQHAPCSVLLPVSGDTNWMVWLPPKEDTNGKPNSS